MRSPAPEFVGVVVKGTPADRTRDVGVVTGGVQFPHMTQGVFHDPLFFGQAAW